MNSLSDSLRAIPRHWLDMWRLTLAHPWVEPGYTPFRRAGLAYFTLIAIGAMAICARYASVDGSLSVWLGLIAIAVAATELVTLSYVPDRLFVFNDLLIVIPLVWITTSEAAFFAIAISMARILVRPCAATRLLAVWSSSLGNMASMLLAVLVVRELNLSTPLEPAITVGVALITAFFIHDLIVFPTGVRLAIGPDFSYREHLIFSWGTIRLRAGIELPIGVALVYCWLGSPALLFAAVIAYVSVWYMQQLAPQLQQLQETDELRARFFAMASHEVRTPLTSIAGFASTLRTQWDDLPESDRRRFVGIIDDQAERLARLTSNLLMLSRLEAGRLHVNPTNVAVHPAIQAAVSTAARPEDIAISCDSRLYAYADADHLRQLLDNYLTNAQRYGSAPISIDVTSDRAAGEIRVCVTDDGDGVPEAFRSQLFQAFTQADHPSGERLGAGLGLSIVQRLAEANAGRAWHEQPDEGGSRFCFALPLGASPLAASDTAPGSE